MAMRRAAFAVSHPNGGRVLQMLLSKPALVSFAQVSYRPLHTFRFVNADGVGRWARYHWEPEAGVAGQPLEELAKQPHDYLYEEIEGRLRAGPVAFRMELQLAQDGDPVDDPSAMWPDGRERVVVDDDACAARDQLGMKLEGVLAVLEDVTRADRLGRQLARAPRGHEADTGLDLAVHQTLTHGGTVEVIGEEHRDLEPVGGLAALLRF